MYGERLKELRIKKGYKQADVAKIIGISAPAYANYESGKSVPPLDALIALAKHYNVSLDWLCGVKENQATRIKTCGEAARLLSTLIDTGTFIIHISVEDGKKSAGLYSKINQMWYDKFLGDYDNLHKLLLAGTITQEIFDMWLKSAVEKLDKISLWHDYLELEDDDEDLPF